jgi:hypothetical protein
MRIAILTLAATLAANADIAHFDDLPEGFAGTTMISNGVTLSEGIWFVDGVNVPFAIEQADADMPAYGFGDIYSAPNVMTVGGFVTGPNMGFIRVHSWKAHVDGKTFTEGSVDVFYIDDFPGATFFLEGLAGEDVVSTDSYETDGDQPFSAVHQHLSISGPEYEVLRFRIMGGPEQNGLVGVFDNVILEQGGCPADCNADEMLNVLDFVCFQQEWQGQTEFGDCNGDGMYNVLDFVCFQQVFQAGCR